MSNLDSVDGRFNFFTTNTNITLIIDYAHTPDALKNVVKYSMTTCPNYIRLPRVMRDIPATYIKCGIKDHNITHAITSKLSASNSLVKSKKNCIL